MTILIKCVMLRFTCQAAVPTSNIFGSIETAFHDKRI